MPSTGAYYTLKTKYGIRILALNTNLYYTSDKVTTHMDDPADQFVWMEGILLQARRDHEKVCNGLVCLPLFFLRTFILVRKKINSFAVAAVLLLTLFG